MGFINGGNTCSTNSFAEYLSAISTAAKNADSAFLEKSVQQTILFMAMTVSPFHTGIAKNTALDFSVLLI